jgi:competence protein ComEC
MPLLWLSIAFVCGIPLASYSDWPAWIWLFAAIVLLLLLLLRSKILRNNVFAGRLTSITRFVHAPLPLLGLCFALSLGALRYQISQPDFSDPNFIGYYNDQTSQVVLEGVLNEPADQRDRYTNLRLEVRQLKTASQSQFIPVSGIVLARVSGYGNWHYGDALQITGELQTPPVWEEFSYRDYLASQGIFTYIPKAEVTLLANHQGNPFFEWIYSLQERTLQIIYLLYPDPESSLLAGILVGVEKGIPEEVRQAFNDTGTAHIIAISGFNITILAGLFSLMFSKLLGRWRGALLTIIVIGSYTILVGADAAVVRAALMGGLSIFAVQLGRRQYGLNSLALVAALMALFNPLVLWDVGFQLSFAATLGLVLYSEPFSTAFIKLASRWISSEKAQKLAAPVGEYFLFTFAAQLTTLPIMLYHFNRLSLVSLIANPVILPAQPLVMILGGLAILMGLVYLPLGQAMAWLAWPFISFTIRAVEFFHQFQGRLLVNIQISSLVVIFMYLILFLVTFSSKSLGKFSAIVKPGLGLALLGALVVLVWKAALFPADGLLHLYILDVSANSSSGEAILIQTPSARTILVGGGPSLSRLSNELGRRLPIQHRSLDWLIVAGAKENQLAALPRIVQRYPPENVLWAIPASDSSSARYLQQTLAEEQIPIIPAQVGQKFDLEQGAFLEIIGVDDYGASLWLEWDGFRAVLPIGLDKETLEGFLSDPSLAQVPVVLLADRGRNWLNPPEWIEKLQPQLLLLSAAAGDYDGLPTEETLQRLQGYTLLRTDLNGWIHMITDGEKMWVEVERR